MMQLGARLLTIWSVHRSFTQVLDCFECLNSRLQVCVLPGVNALNSKYEVYSAEVHDSRHIYCLHNFYSMHGTCVDIFRPDDFSAPTHRGNNAQFPTLIQTPVGLAAHFIMKEQIAAFQPCLHVCDLCLKVLFLNPALPSHPPHSLASLGIE